LPAGLRKTGKFLPKITIFHNFGDTKPTFLKQAQRWKFNLAWGCGPGTLSSCQIL